MKETGRAQAVKLFKDFMEKGPDAAHLRRRLPELKGRNLACHCKLAEQCHADVLLKMANDEPPDDVVPGPAAGMSPAAAQIVCGMLMELCAGSATFSATAVRMGVQGCGVDHRFNRHVPKVPVVQVDLASTSGLQFVTEAVEGRTVVEVTMAPPCGTASRALERPLPASMRRAGIPEPKPKRSEQFPWGLPSLRQEDQLRVDTANRIYSLCCWVARRMSELGGLWVLENPENSLFWYLQPVIALLQLPLCHDVCYDACMHGGKRQKRQRLRLNFSEADAMAVRCDGSHEHLPWKVKGKGNAFAGTADEAEYPVLFCERLVSCIQQAAAARSLTLLPSAPAARAEEDPDAPQRARRKSAAGWQPRRHTAPVVPEYRQTLQRRLRDPDQVAAAHSWQRRQPPPGILVALGIPAEAKLVRLEERGTGGSQPQAIGSAQPGGEDTPRPAEDMLTVLAGIPWTPQEFVKAAQAAEHPMNEDPCKLVGDDVLLTMFELLTSSPEQIRQRRRRALEALRAEAAELQSREEDLHAAMEPGVRRVMEGKKIFLFGRILARLGYQDKGLVHDLAAGFPVVGDLQETGEFPTRHRQASVGKEVLFRTAKWAQHACSSVKANMSDDMIQEVWNKTVQECENGMGWLEERSRTELATELGPRWLPARRFGIQQGKKVRVVDDCSEFMLNAAVGLREKVDLGGLDELICVAKAWYQASGCQEVRLELSTGEVLQGRRHAAWASPEARRLVARTTDLKSAYKQLAVRPSHRWASVVTVTDPASKKPRYFVPYTLLFGQVAAVMGFNRVARGLRRGAVSVLMCMMTNYFDDYPQLEPFLTSGECEEVVKEFFHLLGWVISQDDDKDKRFSTGFDLLGVRVDLEPLAEGRLVVSNKPERLAELNKTVQEVMDKGKLLPVEAASLAGRLGYLGSFFAGQLAAAAVREVRRRAYKPGSFHVLDEELRSALEWIMFHLEIAKPKDVAVGKRPAPVLVFTDGACEPLEDAGPMVASLGAVIFGDKGTQFFGAQVPADIAAGWRSGESGQVIGQAELAPVILAKKVWQQELRGRDVLFFLDNDAARYGLVKGYSAVESSMDILRSNARVDIEGDFRAWYCRVNTSSNPADAASRLDPEMVMANFPEAVHLELPTELWGLVRSSSRRRRGEEGR